MRYLLLTLLFPLLFASGAFAEEEAKKEDAPAKAEYFKLHPAFVVNVKASKRSRYLQAEAQVMSRDKDAFKAIQKHNAAIRHGLIMLLSEQEFAQLKTVDGKKQLQADALSTIQEVLKEYEGLEDEKGVEAVYFTSFVIQ